MTVKFKRVRSNAVSPRYATDGAAAADLTACVDEPVLLRSGKTEKIPTGIAIELPSKEVVALLFARSGLAIKYGVNLVNGVGVIDSDYRGEVCVGLHNSGHESVTINPGDRIAQLGICPVYIAEFVESDLSETERGQGGFGSTGL